MRKSTLAFTLVFFLTFLQNLLSIDLITDKRIRVIYQQFVAINFTEEYKNRYVPFPFEKDNNPNWRWKGRDLPRVLALLEFERFVKEFGLESQNGLAINGEDPEWHYLPHNKIFVTNYEKNQEEHNLHTLDHAEKQFDFAMVNQTLEHVYDPLTCLRNIYKHMAPGGILYFNVPAMNIQHSMPFHYYMGYTPIGIGVLVELAGFKILSIGQWGNKDYLFDLYATQDWPDYERLLKLGVKDIGYNDIHTPVITWIFAIKE